MNFGGLPTILISTITGALIGYLLPKLQARIQKRKRASLNYTEDDNLVSGDTYKMLLVVRMDLKMGKGKVAAQCAHAACGSVEVATKRNPDILKKWRVEGQAKVVVKIQTEEELIALGRTASDQGVLSYIVRDAGRTQIEAGSRTVLALGPGKKSDIDMITGHLKLL